MRFCEIKGHEDVKKVLVAMADSGRIPHATLFYENEGCGAFPLIMAFLQYLACPDRHDGDSCGECPSCNKYRKQIHPDTHFVFPTNAGSKSGKLAAKDITSDVYAKEFRELALSNPYFLEADMSLAFGIENKVCDVNVAEAKSILDKLSLTAVEDGWKAVVFFQPEKMNIQTANKLLKVVEEPPEKTLFLFITHNPDKVLQTIFSRCQSLRVLPQDKEELAGILVEDYEVEQDEAYAQAGISGGSLGVALSALRDNSVNQSSLDLFSDLMNALLDRDLQAALECGEAMASIDTRERQKAWCAFMTDCFRKIFMIQQGLPQIAYVSEYERDLFASLAKRCPRQLSRKALDLVDNAVMLLERNVSQKILFCDLVDRLFLSI